MSDHPFTEWDAAAECYVPIRPTPDQRERIEGIWRETLERLGGRDG